MIVDYRLCLVEYGGSKLKLTIEKDFHLTNKHDRVKFDNFTDYFDDCDFVSFEIMDYDEANEYLKKKGQ